MTPDNANEKLRRSKVRLSDVAAHLGLSKGTVSRALNGYPDISEATREKVRRAAKELGYRPMAQAQSLRTGKCSAIGLVIQRRDADQQQPFLADFLGGLSDAASVHGFSLTVAAAHGNEDMLRVIERLVRDNKADGFVLPRVKSMDTRVMFLSALEVPYVLFGRDQSAGTSVCYDVDGAAAMQDAVRRLAALGHRRIGLIPGAPGSTYAATRERGYREGLREAGLADDRKLISQYAITQSAGATAAADLLDRGATALIYMMDRAALGAYIIAHDRGLRIGDDFSIISYDGITEADLVDPALSTYRVDVRRAGQRLAELLIAQVNGTLSGPHLELDTPTFLSRGSHGKAPSAIRTVFTGRT
ncbi:LacI family DNA-binding transcriptional regulator [Palleronia caenipelagi]|uniref:LacI family transcriptional regulator n=1 Tax=Palleronia caenipelagi TaxID=2489174 RepID=A0A547Q8Y2_9RHOB|nr:LacI family DNA-binding transcriptional regulator [Palleronia caenipelagi]TRD22857.1 LacI family transcriptional regulator [Palleronia caenipelagi]